MGGEWNQQWIREARQKILGVLWRVSLHCWIATSNVVPSCTDPDPQAAEKGCAVACSTFVSVYVDSFIVFCGSRVHFVDVDKQLLRRGVWVVGWSLSVSCMICYLALARFFLSVSCMLCYLALASTSSSLIGPRLACACA